MKSYDFKTELTLLNKHETKHLEEEFENFDELFPKEQWKLNLEHITNGPLIQASTFVKTVW